MEIEIESKRNNPLLNRTEVYFTIKHSTEGTPNREIIRSELADKLGVKKENIVVNTINTSFGIQETTGYAKVYSSQDKSKNLERDHILSRNKISDKKPKSEKKTDEVAAPAAEVESGQPSKPVEEPISEPEPVAEPEPSVDESKKDEPVEELVDESEPSGEEEKTNDAQPAGENVVEEQTVDVDKPKEEAAVDESGKSDEKPVEETTEEKTDEKPKEKKSSEDQEEKKE